MAARNESKVAIQSLCQRPSPDYLRFFKATKAIAQLKEDGLGPGNGEVVFLKLDLEDPRNAKKAAEEFRQKESRLDVLGKLPYSSPSLLLIHGLDSQQRCIVSDFLISSDCECSDSGRLVAPYTITKDGMLNPLLDIYQN